MSNPEEDDIQRGFRGCIPCSLSKRHQVSDAKRTSIECATECSSRAPSPTPMPKLTRDVAVHTNRAPVSSMPLHLRSNNTTPPRSYNFQQQDTYAQRCHLFTIESEACMEVLAKEGIGFRDWEPPVTKKYSPKNEGADRGHITVRLARRPMPGQQEGVTYVRYYRTNDGRPATTTRE